MRVGGGLLEMKMTTRVERTIKGKEDGEAESRERDWMKGCCGGRQTGVTEKRRKRKIELTVSHMSGTQDPCEGHWVATHTCTIQCSCAEESTLTGRLNI